MQGRKIEFTAPFIALMSNGFAGLFAVIFIAIIQVFKLVTLQVGVPHYSNISGIELVLICFLVLTQILAEILARFTSATSQDASPPSDSYLRMRTRVRLIVLILSILVFVTT